MRDSAGWEWPDWEMGMDGRRGEIQFINMIQQSNIYYYPHEFFLYLALTHAHPCPSPPLPQLTPSAHPFPPDPYPGRWGRQQRPPCSHVPCWHQRGGSNVETSALRLLCNALLDSSCKQTVVMVMSTLCRLLVVVGQNDYLLVALGPRLNLVII